MFYFKYFVLCFKRGKKLKNRYSFLIILFLIIFLTGCASNNETGLSFGNDNSAISPLGADIESATPHKGIRDNTPVCMVPKADGLITYGNDFVTVDASDSENGYLMILYKGSSSKVKLQITGSNATTYTYNLHNEYESFPLTSGSGNYNVAVYENISENQYATIFEKKIAVDIKNEFVPYLYPNQYVNFGSQSKVVEVASKLSYSADNDIDVVTNVYNYIITNISYDYNKAKSVKSGYIPDVDHILESQKGICFDYAALMTAMLRSQQIPTRLEIGYAGEAYHAWISIYLSEKGWVNGIIEFDGENWELMDPTFAASESESDLRKFIGDGSNYITKFIY